MCDNTKPARCIDPEMKFCQYCKYGICIYPEDIETIEDLDGCCFDAFVCMVLIRKMVET